MIATDLPLNVHKPFTPILDSSFMQIDWQAPWLSHLNQLDYLNGAITRLSSGGAKADAPARVINQDRPKDSIAQVLNTALAVQSGCQITSLTNPYPTTKPSAANQAYPLEFVLQEDLPEGQGYEQFIATTGKIPTRDNLHDLFNGSMWLTFPKTKALLNYHHMLEIAKHSNAPNNQKIRGRVRDTITVFDENGAIVVTSKSSIGEALINFDWQNSLVKPRDSWDDPKRLNAKAKACVYIFGHALLEQLIQPRKPLCAHSVVITVSPEFFALSLSERIHYLDDKLAKHMDNLLAQESITPRQLAPLPILGVPYFWAENTDARFYDDTYVFRHGRQRQK